MKVIMTCGGTGGHIYPAISIADKIMQRYPGSEILFIGTKKGMENSLVPAAGYPIKGIDASGFDRRNLLKNFKTLSDFLKGEKEAKKIIEEFAPDAVIGTGGYVTGTVVLQASRMGIHTYIHEQNAVPGMTNKMLERLVDKVFISFKEAADSFKSKEKILLVGNPVRSGFVSRDRNAVREELGIDPSAFVVLCFGGSLGAEVLNKSVLSLIDDISGKGVKLLFVTGKRYYDEIKAEFDAVEADKSGVELIAYANNMPDLMSASDLIVSRAGAIAISEITVSGKPSVLVPSPNVTHNHQYWNARSLSDAGAALLIEEKQIAADADYFKKEVCALISDGERLAAMAEKSKELGNSGAADMIVDNIFTE